MTDQQIHADENGNASLVLLGNHRGRLMMRSNVNHVDYRPIVIEIPTARLLAMIDAEDPDAMRAYLRESAPEVIADLYRPAPAAAEHFDYLDAIPEADSPEDVDERPDVDQARAAGEQIGKIMRAFGDAYAEAMKR